MAHRLDELRREDERLVHEPLRLLEIAALERQHAEGAQHAVLARLLRQ
jgi:hypothetical protein